MFGKCRIQSDHFRNGALEVYLLPSTAWEDVLALQQRLVYEVSGEPRSRAALVLCEHAPIITVGRQGSRRHIHLEPEDLTSRRMRIQWTNRGGGCWYHLPGQLAAYPVLPLSEEDVGLGDYLSGLYQTLINLLEEFHLPATIDREGCGVRVGNRLVANTGASVNNWVTYHGCVLNVCSPLADLNLVQSHPRQPRKMTTMFRELRAPLRIDAVRESFVRHFVDVFGFGRYYLCSPPKNMPLARSQNVTTQNY